MKSKNVLSDSSKNSTNEALSHLNSVVITSAVAAVASMRYVYLFRFKPFVPKHTFLFQTISQHCNLEMFTMPGISTVRD